VPMYFVKKGIGLILTISDIGI
jgi:hypothetical protein